ncbi:UDP-glycosyltransferase 73C6-like [Iris pallida]|uniref:Glycosyltransferase n=1 Tax=Iris pallida TaxID=29817 RepID=A0AAX6HCZ5_IRIPA|nr:UDP-glycosyltransferase 73C6-like [Iris pallida]
MTNQVHRNGSTKPHFILVPLMAQGHMIPMVDMARLLADRGATVSFITTPVNAARIESVVRGVEASGLPIRFVELEFPCAEAGLPEGCENVDLIITRPELQLRFYEGLSLLRKPLESYLRGIELGGAAVMISDSCHYWTMDVAREFSLRRMIFHGPSCFYIVCSLIISQQNIYEDGLGTSVVPGLPHRIEVTRAQAPGSWFYWPGWMHLKAKVDESESAADGVVINTFLELEPEYVDLYRGAMGEKAVLPIGTLSLYNKDAEIKSTRGNKAAVDERRLAGWLDAKEPGSVLYVSFGSLVLQGPSQLIEIGRALESSGRPFVWVLKGAEASRPELVEWMSEGGFAERTEGRGLVIAGWAPQVAILSHPSVGGFVTHCGWNSTLEAITASVPMVTWPHIADQFLNEKLVVEVLRVGVSLGVKVPTFYIEGEDVVGVERERVEKAVLSLMDGGEEGERRRERAREYGVKARMAMEEGGSSYENITTLTQILGHKVE